MEKNNQNIQYFFLGGLVNPSSVFSDNYDRMYPYSYGDAKVDSAGNRTIYTGEELKDGEHLAVMGKQDIEKGSAIDTVKSMWSKLFGRKEIDPRRKMMNELADLDLTTAEGKKRWKELAPQAQKIGVIRTNLGTPEQAQAGFRERLDLMELYNHGKQKYNSFVEGDYFSKNAKGKTLQIADEKRRNQKYGELANFFKLQKNKFKPYEELTEKERSSIPFFKTDKKTGKKTYFVPTMSDDGNVQIIADSADGKNMRFSDKWDYADLSKKWLDPFQHNVWTGAQLTDEKGNNLFTGKGTGRLSTGYSETQDNLKGNLKQELFGGIGEKYSQIKEFLKSKGEELKKSSSNSKNKGQVKTTLNQISSKLGLGNIFEQGGKMYYNLNQYYKYFN